MASPSSSSMSDSFASIRNAHGRGKVAIIDSGAADLERFKKNIVDKRCVTHDFDTDYTADTDGHGTAVLTILLEAATNLPVAVYKYGEFEKAPVTKAFRLAERAGCKLINISPGHRSYEQFKKFGDEISICSFKAMTKDIITCVAAGDFGPDQTSNLAPWCMCVALAHMQDFTPLQLGDGWVIEGRTADLHKDVSILNAELVEIEVYNDISLDVAGKIVVLSNLSVDDDALQFIDQAIHFQARAVVIVSSNGARHTFERSIPVVSCKCDTRRHIKAYIQDQSSSGHTPWASIHSRIEIGIDGKAYLGEESSRAPHPWSNHFVKPNLSALGRDIPIQNVDGSVGLFTGTCFSAPLVCAAMALQRVKFPDWTASMIQSAVTTTCLPMNIVLESERHGLGSGFKKVYPDEDPENPGVVFATTPVNYCDFVLSHPDFSPELRDLAQEHLETLGIEHTHMEDWNLNLPSFRVCFEVNQHGRFDINEDLTRTLEREVTFVGDTAANFKCEIVNPDENLLKLDIEIDDDNMDHDDKELKFSAHGQKRKFRVTATVLGWKSDGFKDFLYAELVMKADGYVTSRCPIVVVKIPRTCNVVVS